LMRVVLTRRESIESPDGVSIFIVSLAQALCELGHEVKVIVGHLRSHSEYQRLLAPRLDLPIIALSNTPVSGFGSVIVWLHAKRIIDRFAPDLVIHSEAVPLQLRGTSIQVVHDLQRRQGPLAPLWRIIRRFTAKRNDYVVATTSELREELVRELGLSADSIPLIPKCIDRQAYRSSKLTARERAIVHAGTSPYEDPGATIRAFGVLDDPSVRLYVVGALTAPTREAIDALPLRLRDRVELLGEVAGDVRRRLHSQVRVAAFPKHYTVPVASATVMEAIATGTPIIGSETLSRDVLVDGVNGIVVGTEPKGMAAAFKRLLNDDKLWTRLSAGASRMVKRFDAVVVAAEYIQLASGSLLSPAPNGAGDSRTRSHTALPPDRLLHSTKKVAREIRTVG